MNQSSSGQFAWQGINNEKYGSSRVLVEAADSRADHSSNMLILRESISAWRADLGQEAHIPRKPSKSQKYLINYWSIILEPNFSIPKWTLIVIQSKKDILTILADFRNIFVVVITLTIAIVVLLSAYQIRRNLIPIEKIIEGIEYIANKNFDRPVVVNSDDEFEELATSFNKMGVIINKQLQTLSVMADIDRLILSTMKIRHYVAVAQSK